MHGTIRKSKRKSQQVQVEVGIGLVGKAAGESDRNQYRVAKPTRAQCNAAKTVALVCGMFGSSHVGERAAAVVKMGDALCKHSSTPSLANRQTLVRL